MKKVLKRILLVAPMVFLISMCNSYAEAGMPSPPTLSEMAQMRLEAISFFIVIALLSALIIQKLWNYLRNDFTRLPLLTYRKSLALVVLWGLAFFIVLVMISGARELMTPGAWERDGKLYKLTGSDGHKDASR